MRNAYALLGFSFIVLLVGSYLIFREANAPSVPELNDTEFNEPITSVPMALTLSSPAFKDDGEIPSKYTCDGANVSPELHIENIPAGTKSLVLVMDDPDIPESIKESRGIEKFDHWALYNILPEQSVIPEETGDTLGTGGVTSRGEPGYVGPCPPDREHRYIFRLYALSGTLNFIKEPTLDELETAAQGMVIERATLIGRYERINQ